MQVASKAAMLGVCFFLLQKVDAQDLSGKWEGFLSHVSCMNTTRQFRVVLNLKAENNNYNGSIGYYLLTTDFDHANQAPIFEFPVSTPLNNRSISISYNASQALHATFFMLGYYVLGRYSVLLDYRQMGSTDMLEGLYAGSNGGKGIMNLRRQQDSAAAPQSNSSIIAALRKSQQERKTGRPSSNLPAPTALKPVWQQSDSLAKLYSSEQQSLQFLKSRKDSVFNTIEVEAATPFLTVELFDNAEIDGDTISIFVNDVLVLHKAGLSAKPLVYRLYKPLDSNDLKVRIIAENLGNIPPNTALIQVTNGSTIKRFFMQADEQSNGVIVFKWKLGEG